MLPSSQTVTKHIIDLPDLNTWKIYKKKNTVLCPVLKPDIFAEVFCIFLK